ncbi:hypothetical protein CD128_04195 [Staphylococcus croceilyticus]|nr:hypothetical protein CD128_04195 [Staphylococcus croceilyticus]
MSFNVKFQVQRYIRFRNQFCSLFGSAQTLNAFVQTFIYGFPKAEFSAAGPQHKDFQIESLRTTRVGVTLKVSSKLGNQFCSLFGSAQILNAFVQTFILNMFFQA